MGKFFSPAIRLYFKDNWTRLTLAAAFIFCALGAVFIIIYIPRGDNAILHYNIYFGIDLLGNWYQLLFIPVSGVVLVALNFAIGGFIWKRDRVISYVLNVGTVCISIIVIVAVSLLIYLNR